MKRIPHSWRKLIINERLNIPGDYFGIPESEIERIRRIGDGKERLIEAAKLQYETFQDIHTDLTAWIAGYASDVVVRQKFGSTQKLRNQFIKPLLNNDQFVPSWGDKRRNITLPYEMTPELAEESGIHMGDGCLSIGTWRGNAIHKYNINGHLVDEYEFHVEHIANLMKKLYNCVGYFNIRKNRNGIESVYKSKIILEYKMSVLGFPSGVKLDIQIPKTILGDEDFERRCLCGIFDTDFHLSQGMVLGGRMASLKLLQEVCDVLSRHGMKFKYTKKGVYGDLRLLSASSRKVLEEWGLHNTKHVSKYLIWKETKKYFTFTTTPERKAFLDGKLPLDALEKISNERRKEKASVNRFPLSFLNLGQDLNLPMVSHWK